MSELLSLPERPRAETFLVEDLLTEARRGRLRVPHFQRGLQWQGRNVRELFDSIVRGFPIGNLLLWSRQAPEAAVRFGPVIFEAPAQQANYIVDGQQRITALVGALLHPENRPYNGVHAVWVDLDSSAFLSGRQRKKSDSCIPINILGERTRLLQWAREQRNEELVSRAFNLSEVVLRYSIPAYIVRDADVETLRSIFRRVNASGVALSESDVFQALFGEGSEPKPIEAMTVALHEETSFGVMNAGWVLRCVKSVGGLPPHGDYTERNPPPANAVMRTQRALLRVISFLQVNAGVCHQSLMAYRFPLIILARFFDQHPTPRPRNLTLLARWLWRGMLSGEHGQSQANNISRHEKLIDEDEDSSVQRLLNAIHHPKLLELPDPSDAGWQGGSATTKLYANAIKSLKPRDGEGDAWPTETLQAHLSRHKLADIYVPWLSGEPGKTIAGRLLWLSPRKQLPADILALPDDVLDSHAITEDVREAYARGDHAAAAALRGERLKSALTHLVERYALDEDLDRPAIQGILEGVV